MSTVLFFSPPIITFIVLAIVAGYKQDLEGVPYYGMAVLGAMLWFITIPMLSIFAVAAGLYHLGGWLRRRKGASNAN